MLKLVFSGGVATNFIDFFDMWDPKSPFHDPRVRKAVSLAIDRKSLSEADTLGASKPNGNLMPKNFEFAVPIEPDPYDPEQAKKLLAEAGYPNGFDAGDLYPIPPYFATGEAIVELSRRGRHPGEAAHDGTRRVLFGARQQEAQGAVLSAAPRSMGNASTRMAAIVPSDGTYAYGGWPDLDELYKKQLSETDPEKRGAMLADIQKILHERVRFAPIWDYFWPSGVGTAGRGRGADEDRSVSVVGAAGGCTAEAAMMPS